ncbi:hypothetical protein ACFL4H_00025 [Candidatus Neomarinimicrobiota bacterium]
MKNILFILLPFILFGQVVFEGVMEEDVLDAARTAIVLNESGSNPAIDDLMIVVIGKDDDVAITDHADWTQLVNVTSGTGNALYVAWRLFESGDAGWSFTSTDGNEDWVGWLLWFTGHDTTSPIHAYDDSTGTTQYPKAPDVAYTDLTANSMVIYGFTADDNDVPYSVLGATELFNNNNTDTGGAGAYPALIDGTGNTGIYGLQMSAPEQWASFAVIIEAAEVAVGAGWTGTFMGVTNPNPIMGIDTTNIAKIMGVE